MAENEAIEAIQFDLKIGGEIHSQVLCNAVGVAIQTLEKQIPKKVRYEDVGYEQYGNVNVYACICPSCDLEIIKFDDNDVSKKCESDDVEKMFHSSMVHHAYVGLNNYCNRCGQRLDWSDEE
nr:MAG TPA: NADH-PPase NADH pyrophosphatase zinc ribbon domain [Bacteriophage sp.]